MGEIVRWLDGYLPEDAFICNGAGNYATWVHRYFRYKGYRTQLAPTSGSMGYGVPAAVAHRIRRCLQEEVPNVEKTGLSERLAAVLTEAHQGIVISTDGLGKAIRTSRCTRPVDPYADLLFNTRRYATEVIGE